MIIKSNKDALSQFQTFNFAFIITEACPKQPEIKSPCFRQGRPYSFKASSFCGTLKNDPRFEECRNVSYLIT